MFPSQSYDLLSCSSEGCSRGPMQDLSSSASPPIDLFTEKLSAIRSSLTSDEVRVESCDSSTQKIPYSPRQSDDRITSLGQCAQHVLTEGLYSTDGLAGYKRFRSQHFQSVWEALDPGNTLMRPSFPYTELIKVCILKRPEGKLTLQQLYHDLEDKFYFFASSRQGKGWKNTVRHNLSTQPYFIKLDRERGQLGKGHYWAYCPDLEKPASLAQTAIVKMSSLWPPFASPASPSAQSESAHDWNSPRDVLRTPRSLEPVSGFPASESYTRSKSDVHMLPPIYDHQSTSSTTAERQKTRPYSCPASLRRRSSPVLTVHSYPHREADQANLMTRGRSATISTFLRPPPAADAADASLTYSSTPVSSWEGRTTSCIWSAPRSNSLSLSSVLSDPERERFNGKEDLHLPRLPPLSKLSPPLAPGRKSLGDYFLSNPISRR